MRLDPKEVQFIEQLRRAPDGPLKVVIVKEGNRIRHAHFAKMQSETLDKESDLALPLQQ